MTVPIWIIGNHGKWRECLLVLLVLGLLSSNTHAQCVTGFTNIDGTPGGLKCVGLTPAPQSTLAAARGACRAMGRAQGVDADLARIQDTDLPGLGPASFTGTYWVGLTDASVPTAPEWLTDCTAYSGMTDPDIAASPCATESDCYCHLFNPNQFTPTRCTAGTSAQALCEVTQVDDFPDIQCPMDYLAIKDRCYRFHTSFSPSQTFDMAEAVCQATGGNLARVNQYDCNFAQIYNQAVTAGPTASFLIGLRNDGADDVWRDGTMARFLSETGTGDCTLLNAGNGAGIYTRTSCTTAAFANFICEHDSRQPTTPGMETTAGSTRAVATTREVASTGNPVTTDSPDATTDGGDATTRRDVTTDSGDVTTADSVTTPPAAETTATAVCCPTGSELIDGACFAIVSQPISTFNDAIAGCEGVGGSLARVSPAVNLFIVDYFGANPLANPVWIGLRRDANMDIRWLIDNSIVVESEASWATGQPTGRNGEDCAFVVNSAGNVGNWFLSNCFATYEYMCQFDQTTDCTDPCSPSPCNVAGPGAITCTTPGFGMAECTCADGYVLETELGPCIDVNECSTSPCDAATQNCVNFDGGFQCNCNNGLQQNPANPGGPCIAIDICENVVCSVNGPGTIFCNANGLCECASTEYQLDTANGPCLDVNECAQAGGSPCDAATTTCQNDVGGFTCNCQTGFVAIAGNPLACASVAEPCNPNPCLPGEFSNIICNPTTGACSCPANYELSGGSATGPCVDINECAINSGGCDLSSTTCVNTNGGFSCNCISGYEAGGSATACIDINECALNTDTCIDSTTTCFNLPGTFRCDCRSGYTRPAGTAANTCVDVNECVAGQHNCDLTTTSCGNTNGGFTCSCLTNYVPTGQSNVCQDVCSAGQSSCDLTSTTCVFSAGSVTCTCLTGFEPITGSTTACQAEAARCCPSTGVTSTDDNFYATPGGTCILFAPGAGATFDAYRDGTACSDGATTFGATGGQLLVLSGEDVRLDEDGNGFDDLRELFTDQVGTNVFTSGVYVNLRRATTAGSLFTWGDGTTLANNDPQWLGGQPLSGTNLNCGILIGSGSTDIGIQNTDCSSVNQAYCQVDTVTCPSALTARALVPFVEIDGEVAEFEPAYLEPNSEESQKLSGILLQVMSGIGEKVFVRVTGLRAGSIIVHAEVTVPRPRKIRDYQALRDAIMQLGETDENGLTTITTSTGETIVLDSNRLTVDDINDYVCHEDSCMNGGTCSFDEELIQAQCQCMEGFQGDRCDALKEDTSTALIVALAVATVVMVVVFFSCFCCLFVLSRNRAQQKNKSVYQYRPPVSQVFAPREAIDAGDQPVVVNTVAGRISEDRFRRPVNIPQVVRNRGHDRDTEMDSYSYDNPSMAQDEHDVESSVDQKRLNHFERVFYNAAELNSRMSSRGDAASVVSGTTSSTNSIYKPPLSDVMEPVDETREFNTPYTADGTENI